MILTGKAKENFINWCKKQTDLQLGIQIPNTIGGVVFSLNSNPEILPKRIINALIIEWFDSVGIYINIENLYYQSWWYYKVKQCPDTYEQVIMQNTRQEAIEKAIEKANEIYNQR